MDYPREYLPVDGLPRAASPLLQHLLDTYLSETNKTAAVWAELRDHQLGFRPHARSSTVGEILKHQILSERRFFAEFIDKWNCGAPISRDEFVARLRPSSVSIESDRSAALEFEDEEDMFRGHAIVVRFDPESAIVGADLDG